MSIFNEEQINKGGTYNYEPQTKYIKTTGEDGEPLIMQTLVTVGGKPCERPPMLYPYSYTRFCLWMKRWKPTDNVLWTDRLLRSGRAYDKKRDILGTGDYFSSKRPERIEMFLCHALRKRVILTAIEEECNYADGYPYWLLYYRLRGKEEEKRIESIERIKRMNENCKELGTRWTS